jgi:uncharacterized protein YecE (DUF72 family)
MSNLFAGTSGWVYSHWQGIFYPENLPSKDKLKYYSSCFKTVEINYSFYHLPGPSTYQNWYNQTPANFRFAVKASRFITHIKRLKGVKKAWKQFLENALNLKEKLGPILFQFPSNFQATEINIKRLNEFLKLTTGGKSNRDRVSVSLRYVFEFRHKSWCEEKIYKLLKKYNAGWVIADSPKHSRADVVTANFTYIRMHGSKVMFASRYSKEEIKCLAAKIKNWLKTGDVYCYFNNDFQGYALENAKEILKILK